MKVGPVKKNSVSQNDGGTEGWCCAWAYYLDSREQNTLPFLSLVFLGFLGKY